MFSSDSFFWGFCFGNHHLRLAEWLYKEYLRCTFGNVVVDKAECRAELDFDRMAKPLLQLPDISTAQGLLQLEGSLADGKIIVDPRQAAKLIGRWPSLQGQMESGGSELATGLGCLLIDGPNRNPGMRCFPRKFWISFITWY